MESSGFHTKGFRFFILYKSANHLNFKHTVFGGVVGGLTTLSAMEKVPVDDNDRLLEEIKVITVTVLVNPYTELGEEESHVIFLCATSACKCWWFSLTTHARV